MLLSGGEIREAIESESSLLSVEPFSPDNLQPASLDLRLDSVIQVQRSDPAQGLTIDPETVDVLDLLDRYKEKEVDISGTRSWKFEPGRFVIGRTLETVRLPLDLAGRVEGRSRLARLGISVHITAPKIDPGFRNHITLEMYNIGRWTIELKAGMKICTLLIEQLGKPAEVGYTGMFQGSDAAGR